MLCLFLVWENQGNVKHCKGQTERNVSGNALTYDLKGAIQFWLGNASLVAIFFSNFLLPFRFQGLTL